jgi:hypothetical protein
VTFDPDGQRADLERALADLLGRTRAVVLRSISAVRHTISPGADVLSGQRA